MSKTALIFISKTRSSYPQKYRGKVTGSYFFAVQGQMAWSYTCQGRGLNSFQTTRIPKHDYQFGEHPQYVNK